MYILYYKKSNIFLKFLFSFIIFIILCGNLHIIKANAEALSSDQNLPHVKINFAVGEHYPLIKGQNESFFVVSTSKSDVTYKVLINKVGTDSWTDVTGGYIKNSYPANAPAKLITNNKFSEGNYKVCIQAKALSKDNNKSSTSNTDYDDSYTFNISCLPESSMLPDSTGNIIMSDKPYVVDKPIIFYGIDTLPYTYKYQVNCYNIETNTWQNDTKPFRPYADFTPTKEGNYLVRIDGESTLNTADSSSDIIKFKYLSVEKTNESNSKDASQSKSSLIQSAVSAISSLPSIQTLDSSNENLVYKARDAVENAKMKGAKDIDIPNLTKLVFYEFTLGTRYGSSVFANITYNPIIPQVKNITITTSIPGAYKYKIDGCSIMQNIGEPVLFGFKPQAAKAKFTLYGIDGIHVIGSGTLDLTINGSQTTAIK